MSADGNLDTKITGIWSCTARPRRTKLKKKKKTQEKKKKPKVHAETSSDDESSEENPGQPEAAEDEVVPDPEAVQDEEDSDPKEVPDEEDSDPEMEPESNPKGNKGKKGKQDEEDSDPKGVSKPKGNKGSKGTKRKQDDQEVDSAVVSKPKGNQGKKGKKRKQDEEEVSKPKGKRGLPKPQGNPGSKGTKRKQDEKGTNGQMPGTNTAALQQRMMTQVPAATALPAPPTPTQPKVASTLLKAAFEVDQRIQLLWRAATASNKQEIHRGTVVDVVMPTRKVLEKDPTKMPTYKLTFKDGDTSCKTKRFKHHELCSCDWGDSDEDSDSDEEAMPQAGEWGDSARGNQA